VLPSSCVCLPLAGLSVCTQYRVSKRKRAVFLFIWLRVGVVVVVKGKEYKYSFVPVCCTDTVHSHCTRFSLRV